MTAGSEEKALTLGMDRQIVVTPDQMAVIKNTIFPEATDDELKLFIYNCQRKGVHPMDKLIHPIKRGGKVAFQASIDYLRAESESSGDYRGMKQPVFEMDHNGKLESATVTVLREINGHEVEFTATAYWTEFYPGEKLGFMWDKMPRHMLAKCAEALARRMAWPKKLADLYTPEEMAQADSGNTSAGNRREARSSSVQGPSRGAAQQSRPQQSRQDQPVEDGEFREISIEDEITAILAEMTGGEYPAMNKLLEEVSGFQGSNGWSALKSVDKLQSASAKWKQGILRNLKEKQQGGGREPGAEG